VFERMGNLFLLWALITHEALEQAKAALTLTMERIKWYYDKKVQSVPFKVGKKVLLNLKDYQTMERAL